MTMFCVQVKCEWARTWAF